LILSRPGGIHTMSKRGKVTLFVLLGLLGLLWLEAANPFNFFVRRSEHFSMKVFRGIQPGMHIEDAISLLGKPITVQKSAGLVCVDCTAYVFLGDPPPWLLCYQEAWLLVDSRGKVVNVTVNSEP
jgi:hypothetical protein